MSRPLRSPAITAGSPLLRAGPPADTAMVLSASRFLPPCALPLATRHHQHQGSGFGVRLPTFRAEAADRARAASMPDTAWPIDGHPPGSSRACLTARFRCQLLVTTRRQRFARARLPGTHLTHELRLFPNAHHDGLQPTQLGAV